MDKNVLFARLLYKSIALGIVKPFDLTDSFRHHYFKSSYRLQKIKYSMPEISGKPAFIEPDTGRQAQTCPSGTQFKNLCCTRTFENKHQILNRKTPKVNSCVFDRRC
jgi:hypothetical protein